MTTSKLWVLAGACAVAALASAAHAAGRAVLYEDPNFQGRSVTVEGSERDLTHRGFNDETMSGRFEGTWQVCKDLDYEDRCVTVTGDVPNFDRLGLGHAITSLRQLSDRGEDGGEVRRDDGDHRDADRRDEGDRRDNADRRGPDPDDFRGYAGRWAGGVPGRNVVFYARPQNDGQDITAFNRGAADEFCRRQGLGDAVYYDTVQRAQTAFRWNGGGISMNQPVLRDVVCRRSDQR
jgi:hypothetical protein